MLLGHFEVGEANRETMGSKPPHLDRRALNPAASPHTKIFGVGTRKTRTLRTSAGHSTQGVGVN